MDISQPSAPAGGGSAAGAAAPGLRASDTDRERTAAVLQAAAAAGRLSVADLEHRLDQAFHSTHLSELAALTQDLPASSAGTGAAVTRDAGFLHQFTRRGRWRVGEKYQSTVVISSGVIDLRSAEFAGPETTIHIKNWVGSVFVVVPEDADVRVTGTGLVGGFLEDRPNRSEFPTGPRITITGYAVAGSVFVVHELPSAKERRLAKAERKKSIGG
jgi:hypothetical protein